ncbi:MAG: hypothetical protein WC860_07470 [Candidatus Margulisiibacteriota bacterium]|jgi:hypothetical protein
MESRPLATQPQTPVWEHVTKRKPQQDTKTAHSATTSEGTPAPFPPHPPLDPSHITTTHVIKEKQYSEPEMIQMHLAAAEREHPVLLNLPPRIKDLIYPLLAGLEKAESHGLITREQKEAYKAIILQTVTSAVGSDGEIESAVLLASLTNSHDTLGKKNDLFDVFRHFGRIGIDPTHQLANEPIEANKKVNEPRKKEMLFLQYQMYLLMLSKIDGKKATSAEVLKIFENLYAVAKRDGNTAICKHIEAQISANKVILGESYYKLFDETKSYTFSSFAQSGENFKYLRPVLEQKFAGILEKQIQIRLEARPVAEEASSALFPSVPRAPDPPLYFIPILLAEAQVEPKKTFVHEIRFDNEEKKASLSGALQKNETELKKEQVKDPNTYIAVNARSVHEEYQSRIFELLIKLAEKDHGLRLIDDYLVGIVDKGTGTIEEKANIMLSKFIAYLATKIPKGKKIEGKEPSLFEKLTDKFTSFKDDPSAFFKLKADHHASWAEEPTSRSLQTPGVAQALVEAE